MKPLTTSIYTFEDLINEGCLYVDKTAYLHKIINAPPGAVLSRPAALVWKIAADLNPEGGLIEMIAPEATMLGYTQAELESNFGEYIDALAAVEGSSREASLDKLRELYNGYRFHQKAQTVYNPVSVMKCFQDKEFRNYWFETGTPTFLVDLLEK